MLLQDQNKVTKHVFSNFCFCLKNKKKFKTWRQQCPFTVTMNTTRAQFWPLPAARLLPPSWDSAFKTPTAPLHMQRTKRKFLGSWARHTFLCSWPLPGWSYTANNYVIFFLRLVSLKKPFLLLQSLLYSLWTSAYPATTFIISSIPGFLTSSCLLWVLGFFNKKLCLRYKTPIITFYI